MSDEIRDEIGFGLFYAQQGLRPPSCKVLRGFGGSSVIEIIADDSEGTYRAVYTVRFAHAVYVLHVFQKKSKRGIETPKKEIDLITRRLRAAEQHYRENEDAFRKIQTP